MSLSSSSTNPILSTSTTIMMFRHVNAERQRRMAAFAQRMRNARARAAPPLVAASVPVGVAPVHYAPAAMPPPGDMSDVAKKELVEIGRHFAKIATRFAFDANTPSYNSWVIQFKAEAENCGLEDTLVVEARVDDPLARLRQKTVYNMILACVPKTVMASVTTNLRVHSACEAWQALRRQFIGDEATYLQALEARFQRLIWADGEEFTPFEIRFDQLVSELEAAGQAKPDHVKKSVFLNAIELSSQKDVRGAHVFDRFNTTSKIHYQVSFAEWMTHLRVEAQHIRDAITADVGSRRGTKRAHEKVALDSGHIDSYPVSFVTQGAVPQQFAPAGIRPPPFRGQRRSTPGPCFNMQNTGSCKFGAQCKFSHEPPQNRQSGSPPAPSSAKREACRNFLAGRCFAGDRCRYLHSNTDTNATVAKGESVPHLIRSVTSSGSMSGENAGFAPRF